MSCALKFNNMKTEAIQLLIETMHFTSLGDYINLPAYIQ